MSNGSDNTLLLAGLVVAGVVGFYLYTEPSVAAVPPAPVPPPQPGGGPGPSANTPMPPFPAPKGYLDVGMTASTQAIVQNELATDNDPVNLQGLATALAAKGFTSSAATLNAKAFILQQSDPSAFMVALQTAPNAFQPVVYSQPDTTPVKGKTYRVATSAGTEFWSDPGPLPPAPPALPTSFTPAIMMPFGASMIATGDTFGVIWEAVFLDPSGIVRLGWVNSLSLTS